MLPAARNFEVWIGSTAKIEIRLKNDDGTPFDHTGSTWQLVAWRGDTIVYDVTGQIGTADGEGHRWVTFQIPNKWRDMRRGERFGYEIERRIGGEEEAWLAGQIIATGGLNTDAEA